MHTVKGVYTLRENDTYHIDVAGYNVTALGIPQIIITIELQSKMLAKTTSK